MKVKDLAVDLSNPKNYNRIPTIVGLTFEEGIVIGHLLFLGDGKFSIKQLHSALPMIESEYNIKEVRKQLRRKNIITLGKIGGEFGRPPGKRKNNLLNWTVNKVNLQKLLDAKGIPK